MGFEPKPTVSRQGEWIGRLMGFPGAKVQIAHLFGHNTHIEFIQFDGGESHETPASGNAVQGHICLRVRDIATMRERMLACGAMPQGELTEIAEGAASGRSGLYIRDPHGVIIELIETL